MLILFTVFPLLQAKDNHRKLAAYPQASYADETGFTVGGIILYRAVVDSVKDLNNALQLQVKLSEKKQLEIELAPQYHSLPWSYTGLIKYRYWPSLFYGIGNHIDPDTAEKYTSRNMRLELEAQYHISNYIILGPIWEFVNSAMVKTEPQGLLTSGQIPGSDDYLLLGTGFTIIHDKRDRITFPLQGSYWQFTVKSFPALLGSDFDFSRMRGDIRCYRNISPRHVFATQLIAQFTRGTAPFESLSRLGEELRAYDRELYQDNHLLAAKLEYRTFPFSYKLLNRLGFVTFLELGEIARELNEFSTAYLRCSYGGGLRISLFPQERFNLRADVGFCRNSTSITIGAGEIF